MVHSSLDKRASLEANIQDLLDLLDPVADKIREMASLAEIEFSCITYSEEIPALFFEKSTIAKESLHLISDSLGNWR